MTIEIHNMIPTGLNVGFEFYQPEEHADYYEFHLNLLIIKIKFLVG